MTVSPLAEQLAAAARDMQRESDRQGAMDVAVQLAVQQIHAAEHAGITLLHHDRSVDSPAVTSEVVARIDALQVERDQGPCLQALRNHETANSPNLADDQRWPDWGREVVDKFGIRSMLCFQLFTHRDTLGAFNLYSSDLDAFSDEDRDHAIALAAHVAVAMAAAHQSDDLRGGLLTRTTIGQAQGILMERFDMDAARAFAVLTRISQQTNTKLRDVAAQIVETRRLPQAD